MNDPDLAARMSPLKDFSSSGGDSKRLSQSIAGLFNRRPSVPEDPTLWKWERWWDENHSVIERGRN
jgi:hypothetical protein